MKMNLLLGIDMGTGGCKTTIIDKEGNYIASGFSEYSSYHPYPGWTEQRAHDWMPALLKSIKQCFSRGDVESNQVIGICVDGSAHNVVLLDKYSDVIRNTIMWTDLRSTKEADILANEYGDYLFNVTFQKPSPTWTLPQLMWIKNNEPDNFYRINRIFFIKDYIRFLLTGIWVTDFIEAQGSLLFDNHNWSWSEEICIIGGINFSSLPPIVSPGKIVGKISNRIASLTGMVNGVPVIAGTTDTALENYCVGAIRKNDCVIKIASAGNVSVINDKPMPDKRGLTYSHIIDDYWYTVYATNSAAYSLRWYKDVFFNDLNKKQMNRNQIYEKINSEAEKIPSGCDGLFFHPYLMGERSPFWNEELKASFLGITAHHSRGHFNRAIMEGVAFSIKSNFEIVRSQCQISEVKILGGGVKSKLWGQIIANVLDVPLVKYQEDDSSLGGAILTGVSLGVFKNHENAIKKSLKLKKIITPENEEVEIYKNSFLEYSKIHYLLEKIYSQKET